VVHNNFTVNLNTFLMTVICLFVDDFLRIRAFETQIMLHSCDCALVEFV
jgi:hypothetical protein